jgi:hypothetical protein
MLALEEWEMENIPQLKSNALDRLVAAGKIKEIDRDRVTFIVRTIIHPPERPDAPWPKMPWQEPSSAPEGHNCF